MPYKNSDMRILFPALAFFLLLSTSCKDDDAQDAAGRAREVKKKAAVFATLEKNWAFHPATLNPQTQAAARDWGTWREFMAELRQKPKSSIDAFRKKSKAMTQRVNALKMNIPAAFDKPEIKARVTALTVTVQSLDLYVNLEDVPAQKVVDCIKEINLTIDSMQLQMEEIVARGNVRVEQGESDMIRMLDTSRAIPSPAKEKRLELR